MLPTHFSGCCFQAGAVNNVNSLRRQHSNPRYFLMYNADSLPVGECCGNLPLRAPPCFLANHIEWKQRGSDRKVRAASLIVSDCLVYFPRPCPPISPVIYARLGQSWSCVAMARDCLHPVMLYSHVGTHSLQRALLFVYHLFRRTPPPSL